MADEFLLNITLYLFSSQKCCHQFVEMFLLSEVV
jgi:hypothetical protein